MARSWFGGTHLDVVMRPYRFGDRVLADLAAATIVEFFDAEEGGNQYTDLLLDGNNVGSVTADGDGYLPRFQGPDGVLTMWADAGDGRRFLVLTTDGAIDLSSQLSTRIPTSEKGAVNGVATLDSAGRLVEAVDGSKIDTGTIPEARIPDLPYVEPGELVFNVKDYGAVGDGVTDDTSAVQAALTAAAPDGRVYVPSGAYRCGFFTISAPIFGEGTILKSGTAANWINVGSDVTIRHLTFDTDGQSTVNVLNFPGVGGSDVEISNCVVKGSVGAVRIRNGWSRVTVNSCRFDGSVDAAYIDGTVSDIAINHCRFTNWTNRAIWVLGTATTSASRVRIVGNTITTLGSGGVARQPITFQGNDASLHRDIQVIANTVIGPGTNYNDGTTPGTADQISLHRCADFVVAGNITRGGGDAGITIARQCERGVIAENVATGNATVGLFLGSADSTYIRDISATGNVFANNGQSGLTDWGRSGVNVAHANRITITGNTLVDSQGTATQQYGISLGNNSEGGTSDTVTIGPNMIAGNGLGDYLGFTGNVDVTVESSRDYTATELADATSEANLVGKVGGAQVWDSTNARPVWASGSTAGATWTYADGTTAHTPS